MRWEAAEMSVKKFKKWTTLFSVWFKWTRNSFIFKAVEHSFPSLSLILSSFPCKTFFRKSPITANYHWSFTYYSTSGRVSIFRLLVFLPLYHLTLFRVGLRGRKKLALNVLAYSFNSDTKLHQKACQFLSMLINMVFF